MIQKRTIVWVPLEPLEERYTSQWARWFPDQFRKDDITFSTIHGLTLTSKVEVGSVLDAYGTSYFKLTQLADIVQFIQKGIITSEDVLLFADLWFPGLEALEYISRLDGKRPFITGILHAGSWDPFDFTVRQGMRPWSHNLEQAWFQIYDLVFVATNYHKNLILQSHNVIPDKIVVTGLPFYPDEFTVPRENFKSDNDLVVFPHRLDPEKHPEIFDNIASKIPALNFSKTAEHFTTKSNYYDELARARIAISCADQETFGYAMLEATALGCIPLVPDKLSYKELFPKEFRYRTQMELIDMVKDYTTDSKSESIGEKIRELARSHRQLGSSAITNMTKVIQSRLT